MRATDVEVAIRAAEAGVVRARCGARLKRFAQAGDDFATEVDIAAADARTPAEPLDLVSRGRRPGTP
ncbi:hypothetical protein GCM10022243_42350 [Saccharothrix violaceirubra]|uniref:Uncharacterized protein n=1 Tax=Saccharothrix violaceirubra TaxID=413306 RepID=A0A7W7WWF4_9PSEU|nr:hypothetical protein [Saccharothrix violaceirubra]MBB4965523.1 hypothetical protein [Saccharothrix violaceirubra]